MAPRLGETRYFPRSAARPAAYPDQPQAKTAAAGGRAARCTTRRVTRLLSAHPLSAAAQDVSGNAAPCWQRGAGLLPCLQGGDGSEAAKRDVATGLVGCANALWARLRNEPYERRGQPRSFCILLSWCCAEHRDPHEVECVLNSLYLFFQIASISVCMCVCVNFVLQIASLWVLLPFVT